MQLRNKKTGEIVIFGEGIVDLNKIGCKNVAEMMEAGWEDVPEEETKGVKSIYFIGAAVYIEMSNQKEAIKVEEKLKAFKRLKDKGFRFTAWKNGILLDETVAGQVRYEFPIGNKDDIEKDLDLLFSGDFGGEK